MPNALLVYPKNPRTFWSFDDALKMVGRKSAFPPLGLLTIAGMMPDRYDLRLVDMNVTELTDDDLLWADIVITSSMIIHWSSLEDVIARCNRIGVPVLNGGPLPTQYSDEIEGEAVFYLGEAENGFLLPVGDIDGMAAAAIKLLQDDELRQQFGEAGRRWAVERFDEASVVRQYRRIYRRVVED